jgi:hypothetical protein
MDDLAREHNLRSAPTVANGNPYLCKVKLPEPVQPEVVPDNVHVPVTVLLFTVPFRLRTLFVADMDFTRNVRVPLVMPLKLPLSVNPPLAVVLPWVKQGEAVVKSRLVTDTAMPLLWLSVIVNANEGEPLVPSRVAVQLPLTLLVELDLPLPQPPASKASAIASVDTMCFMGPRVKSANHRDAHPLASDVNVCLPV